MRYSHANGAERRDLSIEMEDFFCVFTLLDGVKNKRKHFVYPINSREDTIGGISSSFRRAQKR